MKKDTGTILNFLLILCLAVFAIKQYVDIKGLRAEIDQFKSKRYVTWEVAKQRATYIDWQVQELGMTCGDAVSIANAAYDMVYPTISPENEIEYTTEELDSMRATSSVKAYAMMWGLKSSLEKIHEDQKRNN